MTIDTFEIWKSISTSSVNWHMKQSFSLSIEDSENWIPKTAAIFNLPVLLLHTALLIAYCVVDFVYATANASAVS